MVIRNMVTDGWITREQIQAVLILYLLQMPDVKDQALPDHIKKYSTMMQVFNSNEQAELQELLRVACY